MMVVANTKTTTQIMSPSAENRRLIGTSSQTARYDVTTITERDNQQDDAWSAMLDPQSLSPAKKRIFVCGMVLASFLASLDLTGMIPQGIPLSRAVANQLSA